jgi:sugar lactone lactonase YvrE
MTRALIAIALAVVWACVFPAAKAQAHPSWGIIVDHQGQVYFSDLKTVWKVDAQGKLSLFRASGDRHTHDLNIDEAGNLYGADNSYEPATKRFFSSIWKMTPAGDFSYLLAPTDNPPEGVSIWRDRDGNTYHATNFPGQEILVLQRTPGGDIKVLVGSNSAVRDYHQGVPYSIGGMAFGADGALYFAHGANVSKVTMSGTLTTLARDLKVENASGNRAGAVSPARLLGLAVDAQGSVFVADHDNRRVLKIAPDGQSTTVLRAEELWFPTGVALRGGDLYILESGQTPAYKSIGTRVRKLSSDGRVTLLAMVDEKSNPPGANRFSFAGEGSERRNLSRQRMLYILLGAGAAIFALTIVAWRVRRRASAREHRELLKQ